MTFETPRLLWGLLALPLALALMIGGGALAVWWFNRFP